MSEPHGVVQLGPLLFVYDSCIDWANDGGRRFRQAGVRGSECTCLDANGRVCPTGREFMRARDEGTYPIRVYRSAIDAPERANDE